LITVKFSADNVRLFKKAASLAELRGAVDLVLERIAQAEAVKLFKPDPKAKNRYNWKTAVQVMGAVLGDQLRYPPFPDPIWYQRVHRSLMNNDLTEEKLVKLAEYARDNLRPPYGLDFLVGQYERVLAGDYDAKSKRGASSDATYLVGSWRKNNALPEE
jgi:hypothetical protein